MCMLNIALLQKTPFICGISGVVQYTACFTVYSSLVHQDHSTNDSLSYSLRAVPTPLLEVVGIPTLLPLPRASL